MRRIIRPMASAPYCAACSAHSPMTASVCHRPDAAEETSEHRTNQTNADSGCGSTVSKSSSSIMFNFDHRDIGIVPRKV